MRKRYAQAHTIEQFEVGTIVIHIPRADHHGTQVPRCLCQSSIYTTSRSLPTLTLYGVLNRHYPTRELQHIPVIMASTEVEQLHNHLLADIDLNSLPLRSPREVAMLSSNTTPDVRCKCTANCSTRRCPCVRAELTRTTLPS